MPDQSANLNLMIKAVRTASRDLMRDFLEVEHLQSSRKGAQDFVSKAQSAAYKVIKDVLKEGRPNYGWLTEEKGRKVGTDPTRVWVIETVNGLENFMHGLPHWAISVALESKDTIVAAAIFDPIKSELFTAEKGAGAWVNGRRMRVSGRTEFADMLFATGLPDHGKRDLKKGLDGVAQVISEGSTMRRSGCPALDLAYVAAGRFDGFWDNGLSTWDVAGGELLVREAGGYAVNFAGEQNPYQSGNIVAAGPEFIEKLRDLVKG